LDGPKEKFLSIELRGAEPKSMRESGARDTIIIIPSLPHPGSSGSN